MGRIKEKGRTRGLKIKEQEISYLEFNKDKKIIETIKV